MSGQEQQWSVSRLKTEKNYAGAPLLDTAVRKLYSLESALKAATERTEVAERERDALLGKMPAEGHTTMERALLAHEKVLLAELEAYKAAGRALRHDAGQAQQQWHWVVDGFDELSHIARGEERFNWSRDEEPDLCDYLNALQEALKAAEQAPGNIAHSESDS